MDYLLWLGITLGSLVLFGLIILVWYLVTINIFKQTSKQAKTAMLDIDELIINKHNLLMQMIELVKRHLPDFAKSLAQMQKIPSSLGTDSIALKQDISNQVSKAMKSIYKQLDQQPEVKTDNTIKIALDEWIVMEESLQMARRVYNSSVSSFNRKIVTFPTSVVAKIKKYKRIDFFEADITLSKETEDIED